jgi:hypothetical protein
MNKYWGVGIDENRYYAEWVKIFEGKEKNVNLLYSIIEDDSIDEEDFSIGCQAIIKFVTINSLWISDELFLKLVVGTKENIKHIDEWFMSLEDIMSVYQDDWVDKRKMVLTNCIENFNCWPKIVNSNFDSTDSLNIIIEKQLALGMDIHSILNSLFSSFKTIAKDSYKIFPNVSIPVDFFKNLEDILIDLKELERKGVNVGDIVKKVVLLMSVKKWLI